MEVDAETRAVFEALAAAIRASDTFQWLTTDVPEGLDVRGRRRRMLLTQWRAELDGRPGDMSENSERKAVLDRALAELDMQEALARALRRLRGGVAGGGLDGA